MHRSLHVSQAGGSRMWARSVLPRSSCGACRLTQDGGRSFADVAFVLSTSFHLRAQAAAARRRGASCSAWWSQWAWWRQRPTACTSSACGPRCTRWGSCGWDPLYLRQSCGVGGSGTPFKSCPMSFSHTCCCCATGGAGDHGAVHAAARGGHRAVDAQWRMTASGG